MTNMEIAKIILQQMGGTGRLSSFVGAKDFIAIDKGVQFRFTAKSGNKSNRVQVKLNGNDLYDVKFLWTRGTNMKVISEHSDVFCENLIDLFEGQTKLFVHF